MFRTKQKKTKTIHDGICLFLIQLNVYGFDWIEDYKIHLRRDIKTITYVCPVGSRRPPAVGVGILKAPLSDCLLFCPIIILRKYLFYSKRHISIEYVSNLKSHLDSLNTHRQFTGRGPSKGMYNKFVRIIFIYPNV